MKNDVRFVSPPAARLDRRPECGRLAWEYAASARIDVEPVTTASTDLAMATGEAEAKAVTTVVVLATRPHARSATAEPKPIRARRGAQSLLGRTALSDRAAVTAWTAFVSSRI